MMNQQKIETKEFVGMTFIVAALAVVFLIGTIVANASEVKETPVSARAQEVISTIQGCTITFEDGTTIPAFSDEYTAALASVVSENNLDLVSTHNTLRYLDNEGKDVQELVKEMTQILNVSGMADSNIKTAENILASL